jgi:hypothetical protein
MSLVLTETVMCVFATATRPALEPNSLSTNSYLKTFERREFYCGVSGNNCMEQNLHFIIYHLIFDINVAQEWLYTFLFN